MKKEDMTLISRTEVKKRFGLTDAIISAMEEEGTFPKAFTSGNSNARKKHKRYLLHAVKLAIAKHGNSTGKKTFTSAQAEKFAKYF